jgi:aspartyl-tRNA(Asn)/glutamyl-tRNA(Gln) amidotransferase subunit B
MITPQGLRDFADLLDSGVISGPAAKTVFEEMFRSGRGASTIAEEQGLTRLNDDAQLTEAVEEVIRGNTQAVQDYLGGKETAIKFLLGQVMKETRGRADPASVSRLLEESLKAGVKG